MARRKKKKQKQQIKPIQFKRKLTEKLSREDFAAMLYKERTKAELLMSAKLTEAGFVFSEQVIIGNYVVDFLLAERNVVIEVDGEYHRSVEQIAKDKGRTKYLNSQGFQVIRVWNKEVKKCDVLTLLAVDESEVWEVLKTPVKESKKKKPAPQESPRLAKMKTKKFAVEGSLDRKHSRLADFNEALSRRQQEFKARMAAKNQ